MNGFDAYLDQAVRRGQEPTTRWFSREDQEVSTTTTTGVDFGSAKSTSVAEDWTDWSMHYVSYSMLKACLVELAQRRHLFYKLWEKYDSTSRAAKSGVGGGDHDQGGGGGGARIFNSKEQDQWHQLLSELYPPPQENVVDIPNASKQQDNSSVCRNILSVHEAIVSATSIISMSDYLSFMDDEPLSRNERGIDFNDALERLSKLERRDFLQQLRVQVQKCATFLLQQRKVAQQSLQELKAAVVTTTEPFLPQSASSTAFQRHIGMELLELLHFQVVNIVTVRQILIRYHAFEMTFAAATESGSTNPLPAGSDGTILTMEWNWKKRKHASSAPCGADDQNHHDYGFVLFSMYSFVTLAREFLALLSFSLQQKQQQRQQVVTKESDQLEDINAVYNVDNALDDNDENDCKNLLDSEKIRREFLNHVQELEQVLQQTSLSVERSALGEILLRDRFRRGLLQMRGYFVLGSAFHIQSGGYYLQHEQHQHQQHYDSSFRMRGRHLKEEMKQLADWRTTRRQDQFHHSPRAAPATIDPANRNSLALNLVSCFIYTLNNYIIEPSSAYYANALGASDALSGLMMGMASLFAISSAVGYSVWTNSCYKTPILFAALLMVLGNWLYATAYTYQSMELCLLGRAIQGLGAPRILNRRFVADATPFALRTAASAAFATATALGAALGPALAIGLDSGIPEFEFYVPFWGVQTFNGMTGPGYSMCVLWLLFILACVVLFQEPKRLGLAELKNREKRQQQQQQEKSQSLLEKTSYRSPGAKDTRYQEHGSDDSSKHEERASDNSARATVASSTLDGYDSDSELDHALQSITMAVPSPTATKRKSWPWSCSCCSCLRQLYSAVGLCMFLILAKLFALESIVGSMSVVTKNRYGWTIANVGTLHLVKGLVVIPVTVFSGYLSQFYEDRRLSVVFLTITLAGMLLLIDVTDLGMFGVHGDVDGFVSQEGYNKDQFLAVGPVQYIIGSLIAFLGMEACESFVNSLLTKVTPSSLAVGTFNSGLLTTLVGTGGHALGDFFVTGMGLISIRNLLNLLILPAVALMVLSIWLVWRNYNILAV